MVDREHLLRIKFYGIVFFLKLTSLNLYCHEILRIYLYCSAMKEEKKNKIIRFLSVLLKTVTNFILELSSLLVNSFSRFINLKKNTHIEALSMYLGIVLFKIRWWSMNLPTFE